MHSRTDHPAVRTFIAKAQADGRTSDAAYGLGALHALQGLADAASQAAGLACGAHHGDYLQGWCKVHGI